MMERWTTTVFLLLFRFLADPNPVAAGAGKAELSSTCPQICGLTEEADDEENWKSAGKREKRSDRIVNGWAAKRGWMVMMRAYDLYDHEIFETCGGALVNKRWVVTAAHCVCIENEYSLVYCEDNDVSDQAKFYRMLRIYVGLGDRNIDEELRHRRDLYEHRVQKVITHPDWKGMPPSNDIALIQLRKDVVFRDDMSNPVLPICMPGAPRELGLYGQTAYVSGWGRTKNDACFTNNFGPERHAKCRFPSTFSSITLNECRTDIPSPSARNKRCQQFLEVNPEVVEGQGPDFAFSIMYNRRKKKTVCYLEDSKYGWCGTCDNDAGPGERGYCDLYEREQSDYEEEMTMVKMSSKWGFCSPLCKDLDDNMAKQMQETRLTILTVDQCTIFNSSALAFVQDEELCAGTKIPYPDLPIYVRKKVRSGGNSSKSKYRFILLKKTRNMLGARTEHRVLDFYLGDSDSCQGDSGGPLYKYHDGRAYIVGVVSRGGDCAGFNQPGIYTNLEKHLDFIQEHISGDNC